jgi:hypothetical protein
LLLDIFQHPPLGKTTGLEKQNVSHLSHLSYVKIGKRVDEHGGENGHQSPTSSALRGEALRRL